MKEDGDYNNYPKSETKREILWDENWRVVRRRHLRWILAGRTSAFKQAKPESMPR
jgi:hypothetical protein